MSSHSWTPAALRSEIIPYRNKVWRMVENQYHFSTMKLAESQDEQNHIEKAINNRKPPLPRFSDDYRHLNFLLFTPFRYHPLKSGSRFRRQGDAGVFYASEKIETAAAEMAFHRLKFYAFSPETKWPESEEFTAFSVDINSDSAIDLTKSNLSKDSSFWLELSDYSNCQSLAEQARQAEIDVIRYWSVRAEKEQTEANIAVLHPSAFQSHGPIEKQSWKLKLGNGRNIEFYCEI